jgi:NifU-like protein involved in Fe-S cluster formation
MADPGYPPQVLEAFRAPRHAGPLPNGGGRVVEGKAGQRSAGSEAYFACRVDQNLLERIAWGAYGSPYLLAGCELAARELQGEPVEALQTLSARRLAADMSAPADRLGELLAIEDALRNCWLAWENSRL